MKPQKNKQVVVDASALLALLNKEPGSEKLLEFLPNLVMSAVNLSEVMTVCIRYGLEEANLATLLSAAVHLVVPFDDEQAYIAANLYKTTHEFGLSLGDRACLALAKARGMPAITADKVWQKVGGVEVIVIR